MDSNNITSNSKLSSANRLSDEISDNRLSCKESMTSRSKTKFQISELAENIQAAETNYDSVKMQWDKINSLHQSDVYSQYGSTLSQKSILSLGGLKLTISEQSNRKEDMENNDNLNKQKNSLDSICSNQVQIVLTPRSQKDMPSPKNTIPKSDICQEESSDSIKTNKRSKKMLKSKKKLQINKVNNEPLKPSMVNSIRAKKKKFHGRLKNSNSKSTIATKETSFSDKKYDRKKFKRQKSMDTISAFQAPQIRKKLNTLKTRESKQLNSKDYIEIYHNNAMKSESLSVVSSRQSKVGHPTHISNLDEEITEPIDDNKNKRNISVTHQMTPDNTPYVISEYYDDKNEAFNKNDNQSQVLDGNVEVCPTHLYDTYYQKNYEMPTMASKMKQVQGPFYHRFNIRNIPFVVGTSISPSHNLGLNIQQVLSIIKTKQPALPGISSLLIRKVTKGIRPFSSLFKHISHEQVKSHLNCHIGNNRCVNLGYNQDLTSYSCEQLRNNNFTSVATNPNVYRQNITCEPLYEEDEESHSTYSDSHNAKSEVLQEKSTNYDARLRPDGPSNKSRQQSQLNRQKLPRKHGSQLTEASGDESLPTCNHHNYPTNNKEIKDVFKRFYEQYDKMTTQHEKLKEQYEKKKDKALVKEISDMDEAIKAKEQEITAVVNLYKEVMSLKHQMRLLHERNSFVCITTEDPAFRNVARPGKTRARAHTAESFMCNSQFKYPKNNDVYRTSNALQLAGLLRQIQAFQRQLALA